MSVLVQPWNEITGIYDALIGCVGYETRASYAPKTLRVEAKLRLACAFSERHELAFDTNLQWFRSNQYEVEECDDSECEVWWRKSLARIASSAQDHACRVCVDISSFSRRRLAIIVGGLMKMAATKSVEVDFVYSVAKFTAMPPSESPTVSSGPITSDFAGWFNRPDWPTVLVIGLGYEPEKALGAIEYLEPSGVWAFVPHGFDAKYDEAVNRANREFWAFVPQERRQFYRVDKPYDCLLALESLVHSGTGYANPIILPFGPKIFSLCCLVTAIMHRPKVAVWRVSSGQLDEAIDRIPNGTIVGLNVTFR
jgi:hypothetical protein